MPRASTAKKIVPVENVAIKKAKKPSCRKPATKPTIIKGTALGVGMQAPPFKLSATDLKEVSLSKMKGHPFVLYFYPKDNTSGCTAEACGFRDALPKFSKMGLTVIGVSKDSLESHVRFKKKFDIDFPLASDPDGKVCEDYGVWVEKSMYGRKYWGIERSTFLIDAQGIVRAVWRHVGVPGHVEQVRKAALEL